MVYCLPQSVVIVDDTPNLAIQPLRKTWATVSAVISLIEIALGHAKRSMQVRMYTYPLEGGSGPMISM